MNKWLVEVNGRKYHIEAVCAHTAVARVLRTKKIIKGQVYFRMLSSSELAGF